MKQIDRRLASLESRLPHRDPLDDMTEEQLHAEIDRLAALQAKLCAELHLPVRPFKPAAEMTLEEVEAELRWLEGKLANEPE